MAKAKPINEAGVDLNGWRDRVASEDGPPSTTRLVLLVLSLYMNRKGGSCHPKVPTIALATGLTERAVGIHLREAVRAGWVEIGRRSGKHWRQNSYQATWPSPERGSGDRGSADRGSADPDDAMTRTTFGSHLYKPPIEPPKGIETVDPSLLPGYASGVQPREPRVPSAPEEGPRAPVPPKQAHTQRPGPSLEDVVNGLRSTYPHPVNRGGPRRTPNPLAIEGWLGDKIRLGHLGPADYAKVLAAAEREKVLAERDPERYRKVLRTWIREAAWQDLVEDEGLDGPVVPPPSAGPKFTPDEWANRKTKDPE